MRARRCRMSNEGLLNDIDGALCVTGLCEVGIDDVAESYDVLEPCGGEWDGRRLCAGGVVVRIVVW